MMLDDTTRVLMEMLYYHDIIDENTPAMELDILAGGDPSVPQAERGAVAPQHGTATATDTTDMGNMAQQDDLSGGTTPNLDDTDTPDQGMDDAMGSDAPGGMDDTMNQGDAPMDNPDMGMGNTSPTSEFDLENKYKLRVQVKELYDVVKNSLDLCREATPPQDPEATHVFYELIKRLDEMKDILSRLMSDLIYRKPYADSLRRFTAVSKAYDLCIAAMYRVFPSEDENSKRKSKTRL